MGIVVDTSVIISVITNEKNKNRIIQLTRDEDMVAPSSLHWEIGNAFSAMLKRRRAEINLIIKAISYYRMIPLRLIEVDLVKSLKIAKEFNIYAYDAYFLECAYSFKLPLLTVDTNLKNIAIKMNIKLKEV